MCVYYYSFLWNNFVLECFVGNFEDFDILVGGELFGDLLKSDLYFFYGVRFLIILFWFYDLLKLYFVWFCFIRDVVVIYYNIIFLNWLDSCYLCILIYKWMFFMY